MTTQFVKHFHKLFRAFTLTKHRYISRCTANLKSIAVNFPADDDIAPMQDMIKGGGRRDLI